MDRLNWVTSDCFNAIAQLTRLQAGERAQPAVVHARMRGFIEGVARRAREAGYREQDAKLIIYALAALSDELMMQCDGDLRDCWASQPLQLLLFGENVAGERFFENLEVVRKRPQQLDVLRVYYLCLSFGFRGRYGVRGAEVTLNDVMDGVRTQISRALAMPEVLSPDGARPEEGIMDASRKLPLLPIALGVTVLSGVLYLGLAVSLRDQIEAFVLWMSRSLAT